MARGGTSSLMPWIAVLVIAMIVFGSLYPFNFNGREIGLVTAFHRLGWVRANRADQLRNVLMYMPLGFALLLWLKRSFNTVWSLVLTCAAGALLSLTIEVMQVYFSRVPSYMDVLLNSGGAFLGALAGLGWGRATGLIVLPDNVRTQSGDRNALLLVLMWIVWRLVDLSFNISLGHLKMALQPLLHIEISWLLVLRYILLWLVVSLAVLNYASVQRGNEAILTVIAIVVVTRVLFVSPAFDSSELLALVLLLPALVVVHALRWIPATAVVLVAMVTVYIYDHVLPLNVGHFHFDFDLLPLVAWIRNGAVLDLNSLLRTLFVFAALIWLLKESTFSLRTSIIVIVIAVFGIEIFHMWQFSRSGSITLPALALSVGLLMLTIDRTSASRSK